jgi:hypothetical protein
MVNKKGANSGGIAAGAMVLVIIVGLFFYGPLILNSLGISVVPSAVGLNHTIAVGVLSVNAPTKVSPLSTFGMTFLVANNLNGKAASNIYFCLDNLGLFKILSSPETSSPNPNGNAITSGRCVTIPSLATGDILSEGFTLSAPPANYYGNIQYSQNIGYYLNFSYVSTASQQLEFVSQSANGNYPPPDIVPSGITAGPIMFSSSSSQPTLYGQDLELGISLNNIGIGIPVGNTQITISLNGDIINITGANSLGFTVKSFPNGTAIFSKSITIGPTGTSIELPISLSSSEYNKLSGSSVPYIQTNVHFSVSYSYEQEGYFPISLYINPYSA